MLHLAFALCVLVVVKGHEELFGSDVDPSLFVIHSDDPQLKFKMFMEHVKGCNCTVPRSNKNPIVHKFTEEDEKEFAALPKSFDWRQKMGKKCPSISHINDQSHCGSCWSFAASEAMSDRICIKSDGRKNVQLSAANLVACIKPVGSEEGDGCTGRGLYQAYKFYQEHGIVSGSDYGSNQGCWPYPFKCVPNGVDYPKCESKGYNYKAPVCTNKCRKGSEINFKKDKHFGKEPRQITGGEKAIMREVYNNGPVSVSFDVYQDFDNLPNTGDVYIHDPNSPSTRDGHALKILGWGETNGVKYWLCANSWTENWGDKGYVKFLRGENQCNIEQDVWASDPDFDHE